jgi:succinate dehydrogenase/fumarate reductase cytochrome b subunit
MKVALVWLLNLLLTVGLVYFGVNAVRSLVNNRGKAVVYGAITAALFIVLSQYGFYLFRYE